MADHANSGPFLDRRPGSRSRWLRWPMAVALAAATVGAASPAAAVASPTCGSFVLDTVRSFPGYSHGMADITAVPGTKKAWAVGYFHDNDATADLTYTARWNGREWKHVPSPSPGVGDIDDHYLLSVSALSADDVWAVGYQETSSGERTLIEHWNGRRWKVVKSVDVADYQSLNGVVAIAPDDVWAVGRAFHTASEPIRQETLIEHWDGRRWKVVPSPNLGERDDNRLVAVTPVPGTDEVIAVGYHQWQDPHPIVLRWDGEEWNVESTPVDGAGGGYLSDVAAAPDGTIWTVGFSIDAHDEWHGLAAQWDGSAWTANNPAPPPGTGYNPAFGGVTVTSANEVWAVGAYYLDTGARATLAERWNGSEWEIFPSANPGGLDPYAANVFNGVAAISPTRVHTVGYYHLSGFNPNQALFEGWCP